jgi:hypothetical protein
MQGHTIKIMAWGPLLPAKNALVLKIYLVGIAGSACLMFVNSVVVCLGINRMLIKFYVKEAIL